MPLHDIGSNVRAQVTAFCEFRNYDTLLRFLAQLQLTKKTRGACLLNFSILSKSLHYLQQFEQSGLSVNTQLCHTVIH